jgi:CRISPR/Cas system Type II protein with McrA/HNH and RuvC-like nuclease domain
MFISVPKDFDSLLEHKKLSYYARNSAYKKKLILRLSGEQNHRCAYCGQHMTLPRNSSRDNGMRMTIDHVIPVSEGGEDTWENVVAACADCNSIRQSKPADEFFLYIQSLEHTNDINPAKHQILLKREEKAKKQQTATFKLLCIAYIVNRERFEEILEAA